MWLIRLNVVATKDNTIEHPEMGKASGAYVTGLISFPEPYGAKELAKYYATKGNDHGWQFKRFDSDEPCTRVTRADFKDDPDMLACFEEAKKDGYSLLFHIYPRK